MGWVNDASVARWTEQRHGDSWVEHLRLTN
jgi:hypothetical protein